MYTSIVLPLGRGSRWNDTELRFCLRSIEKHLTGYGDIFIIGEKPDWLQNVIYIPAADRDKVWDKERNIFNKIMIACNDERVTDSFLFMNDDHFLLQDFVAGEFPYYYDGTLEEKKTVSEYKFTVAQTCHYFNSRAVKYFDVHCPIVYNKDWFKWRMTKADWNLPWSFCIKTMYCRINGLEGIEYPDLKINHPCTASEIKQLIAGRPWFSMGDKGREGGMLEVLKELYPNPSKYEKRK